MTRLAIGLLAVLAIACSHTTLPGLPLTLETAAPNRDCPAAALQPVRVGRAGDVMEFVAVADGQPVAVVWPAGFAARVVDGVATLYASDGEKIATEGDVLRGLGGAEDPAGSKFFVCSIGQRTYGSEPA
ncbi:MAG TPA: hypothetical protein VF253_13425 [Candidatus Limnocylindrales bacterium]|jgi:hypothetical protein